MAKELKNLIDLDGGVIQERINYELAKVIKNIADDNTEAKKKRKIQINIVMMPKDETRRELMISFDIKTTLSPVKGGESTLYLTTSDDGGKIGLFENNFEQMEFNFDEEKKESTILKINKEAAL